MGEDGKKTHFFVASLLPVDTFSSVIGISSSLECLLNLSNLFGSNVLNMRHYSFLAGTLLYPIIFKMSRFSDTSLFRAVVQPGRSLPCVPIVLPAKVAW